MERVAELAHRVWFAEIQGHAVWAWLISAVFFGGWLLIGGYVVVSLITTGDLPDLGNHCNPETGDCYPEPP